MLHSQAAAHGWAPGTVPRPGGTGTESFSLKRDLLLAREEFHKFTVSSLHEARRRPDGCGLG